MMKVLGIYGSPRKGGNSELLLDAALRGAAEAGAEIDRIRVGEIRLNGCRECGGCDDTGVCVQKDGMIELYPRLDAAGSVIVSTPIFFYAVPAQLKALIDRAQAPWNRRRLEKTGEDRKRYDRGRGYLIGVGATRGKNLFDGVELTMRYFFDALDKSYEGGVLLRQVEARGVVAERQEDIKAAYELGRKAATGG